MSLELLDTFATLATTIIIGATAVAALIQLRHLRAGNQISAMLSIGERFQARPFTDALNLITGELANAMEDPLFRNYSARITAGLKPPAIDQLYADTRRAAILVGNMYEELGILVENGIADRKVFLDRYSWGIARNWPLLETFIAFTREVAGSRSLFEHFEYLFILACDWERRYPSSLPKNTPRLTLRNPWPLPPLPKA
ncbi:MAG TPA: hypothetical protein VEJ20_05975 [Candidatus Eremiobacteraceae bacterium]|nr:hypothetical protein [Candidatus Eremiobacteraceae bacterium]